MYKYLTLLFLSINLFSQEKSGSLCPDSLCANYQSQFHLASHILIPISISYLINPEKKWNSTALTYLYANLVDLDHIISNPIYNSKRCSINFHPLHSDWAILAYSVIAIPNRSKDIGTGLLIHMGLDYIDCEMMKQKEVSWENAINLYTLGHFMFWYGIGKYSNLQTDKMFSISLIWEVAEFKLPFSFAKENWTNKSVDMISNYLGFILGRTY